MLIYLQENICFELYCIQRYLYSALANQLLRKYKRKRNFGYWNVDFISREV